MKTGRPELKLAVEPKLADEVRTLFRETRDLRTKERVHAGLLATGEHTYQQIANLLGRSKSAIQSSKIRERIHSTHDKGEVVDAPVR